MDNPFLKRATDFMRDEEAFLAIVSPEPVSYFLKKPGEGQLLYDRLVIIQGAPGSGKTTLGRLFEYPSLAALLRNSAIEQYRGLLGALNDAGAIAEDRPLVLGCRLQLETDYREFWEFPYVPELKRQLMAALIQARAVLAWIRNLAMTGISVEAIEIIPRADAEAAVLAIGGVKAADVLARARAVELGLYKVVGALVPPPVSELDHVCTDAYRPFDVIDRIRIRVPSANGAARMDLQPLVIFDDAHALHPSQAVDLLHWLARRELRVARWVLTRLDVLHPRQVLAVAAREGSETVHLPGITATRDTTEIMLQGSGSKRGPQRKAFRRMAKDMANRYLGQMPLFARRGLKSLSDMLSTEDAPISASKYRELEKHVAAVQERLNISSERRADLESKVDAFQAEGRIVPADLRLSMLSVLMFRYHGRTSTQRNLFDGAADPEPAKPLTADASLHGAARIHLLHSHDRPFFFGIDDLCDAASENAEQFLRLAAVLVDHVSAQLTRGKSASLDPTTQNRLLRQRARDILSSWNFPHFQSVRRLTHGIGERCLRVSLEPNAPLGYGANAYGLPQEEFYTIPERYPDLAHILQYGIAYSALSVVPGYTCKKRIWCLLELGGTAVLHYGLTLKRGGFLEGSAAELAGMAREVTR